MNYRIGASQFFTSLSLSIFSPFITLFALYLGASKFQIGLISSLSILSSIIAQIIGTPVSLTLRRRLYFYIILDSIGAIFFIPIAFVENATQLIILISLQTFFFSLPINVWNEILVKDFPKWKRGREVGILNKIGSIGSLLAYIFAGYVIREFGFIPYLFYSATIFGILSNLVLIKLKTNFLEKKNLKQAFKETLSFNVFKDIEVKKFIISIFFFNFAAAVGAPMFSVYLIENLKADSIDLAIVSIISLLVSVIFYGAWGRIVDYVGSREVILASLPIISLYPLLYLISQRMIDIYIFTVLGQISWVAFNVAVFSYLSYISESYISKYFLIFNIFSSVSTLLGSFISGLLAEFIGVVNVLFISFLLRTFSISFFSLLGNKKGITAQGIFSYFLPYDIVTRIEMFTSIYSLVFKEAKKETVEGFIKKILSLFKNNYSNYY